MFISMDHVRQALEELSAYHPFFGITFLVCKKNDLPIGTTKEVSLDAQEKLFLDTFYKPDRSSQYYFRVFRPSDKNKGWLASKYAGSGSQSTRTRGDFAIAFIHEKETNLWGWQPDYVEKLRRQLYRGKPIPVFYLAAWLYREHDWSAQTTPEDIVRDFLQEFKIAPAEINSLFDTSIPEQVASNKALQSEKITWKELQRFVGLPPDASVQGGALAYLELQGIGPAREIRFEPAERLNLITGDNGLGKTFLLECAWWALTGQWAGLPAYPRVNGETEEPQITFQISGETTKSAKVQISYDWQTHRWRESKRRPTISGLSVYARVDGSFAIWDSTRDYVLSQSRESTPSPRPVHLTREQVWDGDKQYIRGLIEDWGIWQSEPDKYPFDTFKKVLRRLSPRDLGPLQPGELVRLPNDIRRIPTIKHAYGEVPILHAAAGVRRIITLAYLIVWAWEEHKIQSALRRSEPQRRMVILNETD